MRISDWSSDVCSSDLRCAVERSDLLDLLAHGNGLGLVVFLLGRVSGKFLLAPLEHGIAVLAEVHPKALIHLVRDRTHGPPLLLQRLGRVDRLAALLLSEQSTALLDQ